MAQSFPWYNCCYHTCQVSFKRRSAMSSNNLLFYGRPLRDLLSGREAAMIKEIEGWGQRIFEDSSEDDLVNRVVPKYEIEPPRLERDKMYIKEEGEVSIDVSGHPGIYVSNPGKPYYVSGSSITVAIPFEGDGSLFGFEASRFSANPPQGRISGSEILITFQDTDLDPARVHKETDDTADRIERHLGWLKSDCDKWNSRMKEIAGQLTRNRKQHLLDHEMRVSAIGLPRKKPT